MDIDACPSLPNGRGPLHVAAETENVEAVKLLLQHKADVTAVRVKEAFRLAVTLGLKRNCAGHGSCVWNGLYACRIHTDPYIW